MTCQYQSRNGKTGAFSCVLGMYGGNPYLRNCQQCAEAGENTPEFAKRLFDGLEKTHPQHVRRVSGCCDDARNP